MSHYDGMNKAVAVNGERQLTGLLDTCDFNRTSLTIPEGTDFDHWQEIGEQLKTIEGSVMWWIGDWLNFGESHYGETYSQALEITEYDEGTLRNAKWVADQYEMSLRNDNLTWHIHRIAIGSEDTQKALEWAENNNATVNELRDYIRDEKRLTYRGPIEEARA